MKFGPVPVRDALGAILAHATQAGTRRIKKGTRLGEVEIAALREAGIAEVAAAVLDPGDMDENEAARRIAAALKSRAVEIRDAATGRVNLHAGPAGVFCVDRALVDAINAVDPAITIATLNDHVRVEPGRMVATVKIIPFAVAGRLVDAVEAIAARGEIFCVHPFTARRVALIQTSLPGTKPGVLDKTVKTMRARLEPSGSAIAFERRTPHDAASLARALADATAGSDIVIAFGASAVSDGDDVIPAAIRAAGGTVERFGMPVDPGNLLVKGRIGAVPVLGAPGCARSPKENGFDWVLDRMLAGLDVDAGTIAGMGVGGLLMEIATRPQPREARAPADTPAAPPNVHAVLLAAGRSSRMGGPNKLLASFDDTPLVRRSAERALASRADGLTVIVGHQAERVAAALAGLAVETRQNPDFAQGLSTSLKAGLHAVPEAADGALVLLADMPAIGTAGLDALIDAFERSGGRAVVRATHNGKRGNPVILPRAVFVAVDGLAGDTGARHLVESGLAEVIDVEIGAAASIDVDTQDALARAGGVLEE
ncbi:MAG: molybdopterin-binding/glycosyltransferase family 2 protein [Nitratireductor sp.]